MIVGEIYAITLGKHTDKYMVIIGSSGSFQLKRVTKPKSKIDSIRLPEYIHMTQYGKSIPQNEK